ncbi:MAG: heme o synthase [Tepidisphaeraceae bacterium]|jgi:protoheme IX farnesyltransferase
MNTATTILPAATAAPKAAARSRFADLVELIRPRMNCLVLGTTMVGCCLAAGQRADWLRLPPTLLGTALCAAAASILNQLLERRYDALMPRTAHRPLPTGRVSPRLALVLGLIAGLCGGACLWLLVNTLTAILGITTLASYVLIYTPLKRRTTLNTMIGAIPGAIPPVMGWTAINGSLAPGAAALFAILLVWQIPHFMAIAILYREDYRKGGFKMLPVVDPTLAMTSRQILIYTVALLPVGLAPALLGISGKTYLFCALALGLTFVAFAANYAAARTRRAARWLFLASIAYLPILLTILMLNRSTAP